MAFTPRFETLIDIYDHAIKSFGHRELFGTKRGGSWTWTTYAEFGKKVEAFRGGLASLGVGKGDVVAIIANNRVEWAVAAYAVYGLGGAFVPMYEAQHPKEWEFIVKDCEAKVLIAATDEIVSKTRPLLDSIKSLKAIVSLAGTNGANADGDKRVTTFDALCKSEKTAPATKPKKEDIAGLIYTSGTTGNPKGVILTHANLASNVSAVHEVFPIEQADRSLSFLPWAHSFGQTCELHAIFSMGGSMGIAESVEKIVDNLAEVQPTLLFSVPRIFNKIYAGVQKTIASKPKAIQEMVKLALKYTAKERASQRLEVAELAVLQLTDKLVFSKVRARFGGRLKYAFSGGAAISRDIAEFIDSLGIMVYEGYGLTETSPIATANCPGERRIGSVGRAIPGVRIEIEPLSGEKGGAEKKLPENGKPARVEGEIIVYGHNVMKGYHRRDEENAAVFTKDGGFKTGDMGYLDPHGYLYITGRIKEQYKLENGKYVVPTPLEEAIKLSPFVLNVMVYGDNRPFNVALIVANVDAVKDWASKNGVSGSGDALLQNDAVRALFKKEIETCSKAFKGFESVADFVLISEDFTTANNMLTPSLKLKRREVVKVHGKTIDDLYARKAAAKDKQQSARA
jgi:long-chain acyl-CoA synthetase